MNIICNNCKIEINLNTTTFNTTTFKKEIYSCGCLDAIRIRKYDNFKFIDIVNIFHNYDKYKIDIYLNSNDNLIDIYKNNKMILHYIPFNDQTLNIQQYINNQLKLINIK